MAVINKIRDKSWLVLIFVGIALLTFLFSDWSNILGGSGFEYGYGTVYGEMVDFDKWDDARTRQSQEDEVNERRAKSFNQPFQAMTEDQVWGEFVKGIVLEKEYEALGLSLSDKEFNAFLFAKDGFGIIPEFNSPELVDSTTLNEGKVKELIKNFKESKNQDDKLFWEIKEQELKERRMEQKYKDVMKQCVYITELEAKNQYEAMNEVKNVSFIYHAFNTIPDAEVAVDEAKLKAYFEKHKAEKIYETKKAHRDIRYLNFKFVPSHDDSVKFSNNIAELKQGLIDAEDDSSYVIAKSELRFFSTNAFSTCVPQGHPSGDQLRTYPANMDMDFRNASVDSVIGPYEHNGKTVISKVIGFTNDTINARHILLKVQPDGSNLQAMEELSDSILKVINQENFVDFVNKYSEDPGSAVKGGDLGDFFFGQMVPQFWRFCADQPIGEIGKVRSEFGIHIIEVKNRKGNLLPRLASIEKTLKPSNEAIIDIKQNVTTLLIDLSNDLAKIEDLYKKVERFDTLVKQKELLGQLRRTSVYDNAPRISGLQTEKAELDLLELAYKEDAKVGDLIGAPIQDKDSYIIGIVGGIAEKGQGKFEDVREIVQRKYVLEQKAIMLEKKFANAKSLESLVDPSKNISVQTADVTFGAAAIGNVANEKRIVGILFSGLKDGSTTKLIRGEHGVMMVKIEKTTPAQPQANYDVERGNLLQNQRSTVESRLINALMESADVIDNRKFFEKRIRL